MSNYTPTTEDVREVAQTLSKCREFDPELCDGCNRRVQDAERLLKSRWLAEHDRELQAEAWDDGQCDQLEAQEITLPRGVTIPLAPNPHRKETE